MWQHKENTWKKKFNVSSDLFKLASKDFLDRWGQEMSVNEFRSLCQELGDRDIFADSHTGSDSITLSEFYTGSEGIFLG